ncbi:hypothetical protein ACVMAJ_000254 [Bradyrhizobium sp. USDA 4448]
MAKIIEARAVISAADKTGNVLDKIAAKFKGVEKNAKAFSEIKPPKLSGDFFEKELNRLKLTQRELRGVQKEFAALDKSIRNAGPVHPAGYMQQVDRWRDKTLQHWREVKTATEEAGKAHEKFARRERILHRTGHEARHAITHALGVAGIGYGAVRATEGLAHGAAERNRAETRFEQMGLNDQQLAEGNAIAGQISQKFPSLSRTQVLDYLRVNASRLGSWDRSKEVAETYARALIANKLSGGDEHELEQAVRAIEGSGQANTSKEFGQALNMWMKAKAANPDYTGEQFRSDLSAASSAKYGLSKDYMENVFPVLASHVSGFGNKLSTGLSALVGGRMTKQVKGELQKEGLLDKNGRLLDEAGYISNNFEWTNKHIRPRLEKSLGIHFGEEMSEGDKGKVVDWLQHHFSARNAADLMATNLIDRPLVERARERKTLGLEDMDKLQGKDAQLSFEGVKKQVSDFGTELTNTSVALGMMDKVARDFAGYAEWVRTGQVPRSLPGLHRLFGGESTDAAEWNRRGLLQTQLNEADQKVSSAYGLQGSDLARWRLRQFDLQRAIEQSRDQESMPPIYTDADVETWRKQYPPQASAISLPRPRPAAADAGGMPAVQPLDNAPQRVDVQGTVGGSVDGTFIVKAGSELISIYEQMKKAIAVVGQINSNGPGSSGKSSPDANAPLGFDTGMPQP